MEPQINADERRSAAIAAALTSICNPLSAFIGVHRRLHFSWCERR
jgi:hypothetical protein